MCNLSKRILQLWVRLIQPRAAIARTPCTYFPQVLLSNHALRQDHQSHIATAHSTRQRRPKLSKSKDLNGWYIIAQWIHAYSKAKIVSKLKRKLTATGLGLHGCVQLHQRIVILRIRICAFMDPWFFGDVGVSFYKRELKWKQDPPVFCNFRGVTNIDLWLLRTHCMGINARFDLHRIVYVYSVWIIILILIAS